MFVNFLYGQAADAPEARKNIQKQEVKSLFSEPAASLFKFFRMSGLKESKGRCECRKNPYIDAPYTI